MKRGILSGIVFCLSFLFFITNAFAKDNEQTMERVTLKRIGFSQDVVIQGPNFNFSFFVPLTKEMNVKDGLLDLQMRIPKTVHTDATMNLLINDIPYTSIRLSAIKGEGENAVFKIALKDVQLLPSSTFMKVQILIDDMSSSQNKCERIFDKGQWIVLKNSTSLYYKKNENLQEKKISKFLDGIFNQVVIVIPTEPSISLSESYIKLRAFLAREFSDRDVRISTVHSVPNNVKGSRVIVLDEENKGINVSKENVLYIEPTQVDAFISTFRSALFANKIEEAHVANDTTNSASQVYSLKMLGYNSVRTQGIGDMPTNYTFTLSDLGGLPEKLLFVYNGTYVPLTDKEGTMFLKFYLNGSLIKAVPLSGKGIIDGLVIDMPTNLLNRENNFQVVYSYYPKEGQCVGDVALFEGETNNSSFFEVLSYDKENPLTFLSIPSAFNGTGAIVLPNTKDKNYLEHLYLASALYASIKQFDHSPLDIRIIPKSKVNEIDADYYIFSIPIDELNKDIGFVHGKDTKMSIINRDDGKILFRVQQDEPIGILQIFSYNKKPSISIGRLGSPSVSEPFAQYLVQKDTIRQLIGNVAFFDSGEFVSYEIGKKQELKTTNTWNFAYYYEKYKLPFYVIIWVVVVSFIIFIYFRLSRVPKQLTEANNDQWEHADSLSRTTGRKKRGSRWRGR